MGCTNTSKKNILEADKLYAHYPIRNSLVMTKSKGATIGAVSFTSNPKPEVFELLNENGKRSTNRMYGHGGKLPILLLKNPQVANSPPLTTLLAQGSHILTSLISSTAVSRVDTISRRTPAAASNAPAKLTTYVSDDSSKWSGQLSTLTPTPDIFLSAFGTTKAAAGGFENQYKIEHGLNVELARAAHDAGVKVFVLISGAGASKTSSFQYSRMKADIEEDIKALGFERMVILRPGLIAGTREESRPAEAAVRFVAGWAGKLHSSLKDSWAQEADVIGQAAVKAGLKALNGDVPAGSEKVWLIEGKSIIDIAKE